MTSLPSADEKPAGGRGKARALRQGIGVATVLVLGFALYGPANRNVTSIQRWSKLRLTNWRTFEASLKQPAAGRDTFPKIDAAVALLQENGAKTYRISSGVYNDGFVMQRVAEMAWPLVLEASSPFVVRLAAEDPVCTPLGTREGMSLDRCE